jgi:uncharacterized protein
VLRNNPPMTPPPRSQPPARPLSDTEIAELQTLLDQMPAPLEPLDVSSLDGFLAGVALQRPQPTETAWLPFVTDLEGRPLPESLDASRLHGLLRRRLAELTAAIAQRQWFDPWVFELDESASPSEAVVGWVAGFASALERFPKLLSQDEAKLLEPLALLYRHLDPADLEDADALLAEIETMEPPETMDEAVEDLVSATLLLADVISPPPAAPVRQARPGAPAKPSTAKRRPRR